MAFLQVHHALLTSRQAALQIKFSCQCDWSAKFLSLWTFLLNAQPRQPRSRILTVSKLTLITLAEQAQDVLRVVGAVGVVDDAAALVGLDAVLVDHPFEGGAVAEAVGEGSAGMPSSVRNWL